MALGQIVTPMVADEWKEQLASHPDEDYQAYLVKGLREGFKIWFNHVSAKCVSVVSNMQSASKQASAIDNFLTSELAAGRVLGSVGPDLAVSIPVNCFGLVPRDREPGKWQLIVDLSFPVGESINDGVNSKLCRLCYTTVDAACQKVLELGKGTVLTKFDVSSAYKMVPFTQMIAPI